MEKYLVIAILALGFILRTWGVNFGLPHLYHADEPIVVNHALAYGIGDLNPHYFKIPPLISYLLFVTYGFYFVVLLVVGHISSVADFQNFFLSDPSSFYLIGRMIFGVVLGTLTLAIWYFLIRRFFGVALAVSSGFLLAVNFLHVRNSHYLYLDVPLLLVITASFFPILNVLTRQKARDYYLFAVFLGSAVATKYNGFFILCPFLYAHFAAQGWNWRGYLRRELFVAAFLSFLTFVVANPFAFIDYPSFFRDLFSMHEFEGSQGWTYHFVYSLRHALGWPVLGSAVIGLALNLLRPEQKRLTFVFFAVPYYVLLCYFSEQHARYVFPLLPFVLFFAADAFIRILGRLPKYGGLLCAVGMIAIAIPSLARVYLCNRLFVAEDIRTSALRWTEENIPEGSRIALDSSFFMPRLKPTIAQLQEKELEALQTGPQANIKRVRWMLGNAEATPRPRYELYFLHRNPDTEFLFAKPVLPYDVTALKNAGIEYVFVVRSNPNHIQSFYDHLDGAARKIQRFSPYFDLHRDWPISTRPLTGAPLVWEELMARRQNGQIIDVYKLSS